MWVVKSCCKTFAGTYNTIYIDRFYKLMDLFREVYDMSLFTMGMYVKNSNQKELLRTKRPLEYR